MLQNVSLHFKVLWTEFASLHSIQEIVPLALLLAMSTVWLLIFRHWKGNLILSFFASFFLLIQYSTFRCVRFSQCNYTLFENIASISSCSHVPGSPTACIEEYGGFWLPLPIMVWEDVFPWFFSIPYGSPFLFLQSANSCDNPRGVNSSEYPGYCRIDFQNNVFSLFQESILSPLDSSSCVSCGNTPMAPSNWKQGQWVPAKSTTPIWRYVLGLCSRHRIFWLEYS